MPAIAPELKDQLMREGRWGDFVRYREDLKKGGMTNKDALPAALKEFFDSYEPPVASGGRGNRGKRANKKQVTSRAAKASVSEQGGGGSVVPSSESLTTSLLESHPASSEADPPESTLNEPEPTVEQDEAPSSARPPTVKLHIGNLPSLPPVRLGDFEGKKASEVEEVRWVAANMQMEDPTPKDCPSAAAWGHLAQCRDSHQARSDFWKQTYPKLLPTRAQMEAEQDAVPDESKAQAVITEMLRFGKEAEREAAGEVDDDSEVEDAGAIEIPSRSAPLGEEDEAGMEVLEEGEIEDEREAYYREKEKEETVKLPRVIGPLEKLDPEEVEVVGEHVMLKSEPKKWTAGEF